MSYRHTAQRERDRNKGREREWEGETAGQKINKKLDIQTHSTETSRQLDTDRHQDRQLNTHTAIERCTGSETA